MADIKPTAQSLLNGITNDVKGRSLLETGEGSDLAGQFSEVMMSRLSNMGINDKDVKAYLKKIHQRSVADQAATVDRTTNTQATRDALPVKEKSAVDEKQAIRDKLEALVKELANKEDLPVEDTKALKALKKVAEFLVKASAEGDIALPLEMTQKLQAFLAKGDELNAYDMSVFMRDFIDAFRDMKIVMPQSGAPSSDLQWPTEIVQAFDELGLKSAAGSEGKNLTLVDVLRAVKALVNESEKAANLTIDNKLKDVVLPQDQLVAVPVNNVGGDKTKDTAQTAEQAIAAQIAALIAQMQEQNKAQTDGQLTADAQAQAQAIQSQVQAQVTTALSVDNNDIAKKLEEENAAIIGALNPFVDQAVKASDKVKEQSKVWASELPASFVTLTENKEAAKEKTPSLTNMAMNAAFPNRNAKENDTKAGSTSGSADSSQLKQSVVANVVAAAPAPADLSAKIVDKGLDSLGNNMAIGGLENANAASVKNAARVANAATTTAQPSAATQQVIAQIQQKANKSTDISVQLTPAELGRVEVRLSIQRDGTVHAVVMADKPETLALLQKDASQLERSLQQAGLNANSENMSFNLRDQQQAHQFGQGRKRFSRESITDDKVAEIGMTVLPEASIITDNRVNYHA